MISAGQSLWLAGSRRCTRLGVAVAWWRAWGAVRGMEGGEELSMGLHYVHGVIRPIYSFGRSTKSG